MTREARKICRISGASISVLFFSRWWASWVGQQVSRLGMQSWVQKYKRWVVDGPHFFAGVFLPMLVVFTMVFFGGLKDVDILLHKGRTIATVTESSSPSPGRTRIRYRYAVDGRSYTGGGGPDLNELPVEERKPITVGSTYEISYSTAHPSFSTPREPGILFGQLIVAYLIVLGVDFMVMRRTKNRQAVKRV
jgi:hypothetical protein